MCLVLQTDCARLILQEHVYNVNRVRSAMYVYQRRANNAFLYTKSISLHQDDIPSRGYEKQQEKVNWMQ
jgi:hypothetical protein